MSLKHQKNAWLAVGLFLFSLGLPAFGQDMGDLQLFAPAETGSYGSGPQPHEGWFITYDHLVWSVSKAATTPIGAPGETRQVFYGPADTDQVTESNTVDTSSFGSSFVAGDRFELGHVSGHHGWFIGGFGLKPQTQYIYASDAHVVFEDLAQGPTSTHLLEGNVGTAANPVIRPLPVVFDDLVVKDSAQLSTSIELMYMYRSDQLHNAGWLEFYFGLRYIQFNEQFFVSTASNAEAGQTFQSALLDSDWNTTAQNDIIGPQIGAHWFRQCGHLILSAEGRFMAGFNRQNIRQFGVLSDKANPPGGVNEPRLMSATSFEHDQFIDEFSPVVEVRAEAKYVLTKNLNLKAGWTGLWMNGIARPSDMVLYRVPDMGIVTTNNRQDVFVHGLTMGLEFNR